MEISLSQSEISYVVDISVTEYRFNNVKCVLKILYPRPNYILFLYFHLSTASVRSSQKIYIANAQMFVPINEKRSKIYTVKEK